MPHESTNPNLITDRCGNPLPQTCLEKTVYQPVCYLTPALISAGVVLGLPGFQIVEIQTDCSGQVTGITDLPGNAPIAGATVAPCPCAEDSLGVGGFPLTGGIGTPVGGGS